MKKLRTIVAITSLVSLLSTSPMMAIPTDSFPPKTDSYEKQKRLAIPTIPYAELLITDAFDNETHKLLVGNIRGYIRITVPRGYSYSKIARDLNRVLIEDITSEDLFTENKDRMGDDPDFLREKSILYLTLNKKDLVPSNFYQDKLSRLFNTF